MKTDTFTVSVCKKPRVSGFFCPEKGFFNPDAFPVRGVRMEKSPSSRNKILDSLLYLLLGIVFLLCSRFVPILGTVVMFVWALPVILIVVRDGIVPGVAAAAMLTALAVCFMGVFDGFVTVCVMAVLGLFYGISLRNNKNPGYTLLAGVLFAFVIVGGYFILAKNIGGVTLNQLLSSFENYLNEVFRVYDDSGLLDTAVAEGMSAAMLKNEVIAAMKAILPSFFFITAMAITALNYIIAQSFLKKRGYKISALPPFSQWHLPWWLLWGLVVVLMLYVGGNFLDSELFITAAKNILYCYFPILFVSGISLVRYFFLRVGLGSGVQILLWITAILFLSISVIFFILLGAADTAINYRAMSNKRNNNKDGGHEI